MESHHTHQHHHFPPSSSSFKSSPFPAINANSSPQLDLYTIPTQSCWFSWDSIHETERSELREFFDNSSFTRSVKIYKEYRDFMISKYREDPSRRLTFTEVRKSLVGDVCVLRKVFNFLDKWGLINFSAPPPPPPPEAVEEDDGVRVRVRVEEGAPFGVRVVVAPGSLKPVVPPVVSIPGSGGGDDGGFKAVSSLPLASYKDVFREAGFGGEKERVEEVRCGSCKEKCDSKYYECTKEKYLICLECYEKGEFGENKVKEDFKINDSIESSRIQESVWTEAETLLLLESVLKNGDDWEVVAQNVQTKTKHECISRLIELPLGELILGSRDKLASRASIDEGDARRKQNASDSAGPTIIFDPSTPNVASQMQESAPGVGQEHKATEEQKVSSDAGPEQKSSIDATQEKKALSESRDNSLMKDNSHPEIMDNNQMQIIQSHQQVITEMQNGAVNELQNGDDTEHLEPPLKKSRIDNSDPSRSLIEQVALLSTMVGPQITAAAAKAAVTVLSDGNPLVRDIFYVDDHSSVDGEKSGNLNLEMERAVISEDAEMKDASHSSEVNEIFSVRESIPLALQTRAAVGTALGAAAAHARLLADHEEKEIEHLVAFIIETQLKKVERKLKLCEDLEHLMQKQHTVLEESKDSIIAQRLDIVQRIVGEGISRLRDSNSLRPTSHDI